VFLASKQAIAKLCVGFLSGVRFCVGLAVCVVLVAVVVVGKYLYRVLHGLLLADRTGVWRIQEGDYI
jgi:hypothetical protein